MASSMVSISPKAPVSRLRSPFRLDKKTGFTFSVSKASPPAEIELGTVKCERSPINFTPACSNSSRQRANGGRGTRLMAALTPSTFLTPSVLPQRRRSDQDGTPTATNGTIVQAKRSAIRPLRMSPLFLESPYFGNSQFSASKACQALIHSPCRSESYRRQRRRLYHQDEYDDVKRKLSLPDSAGRNRTFRTPKLGNGGFGSVYIGKYDGKLVAIKQLHNSGHGESLCSELIAFRLDHPHIVKILTFSCSGPHMQIVFEYVGHQNLQQLLDDTTLVFEKDQRAKYCYQITDALSYCHSNRILHLDVKPANILVTDDMESCKLGDFGCSRFIVTTPTNMEKTKTCVSASASTPGTLVYKAPELLRGSTPTAKADVYSFGYVMWQCATRQQPFEGMNLHTIVFCVVAKGLRPTVEPDSIEKLTKEESTLIELAQECWRAKPDKRPELKVVLKVLYQYIQSK